jgi:hypothetical protein
MSFATAALAAGVVWIALISACLLLLRRPLAATLLVLCGTRERAQFWIALSTVALILGALLLGSVGFLLEAGAAGGGGHHFWAFVAMIRWSLAGVLLGVGGVSAIVAGFTVRMSRGILPAPPAARGGEA